MIEDAPQGGATQFEIEPGRAGVGRGRSFRRGLEDFGRWQQFFQLEGFERAHQVGEMAAGRLTALLALESIARLRRAVATDNFGSDEGFEMFKINFHGYSRPSSHSRWAVVCRR